MKHLNEEQLILYFYGEGAARDAAQAEEHLAACADCRGRLDALKRDLAVVERVAEPVPGRGETYGAEVWARIAPRLDQRPERTVDWMSWFRLPRLAWAGAMAALLLVAFLAGRWGHVSPIDGEELPAEVVRNRVLNDAVGAHLERSQMLLVELSNAPGNGQVDISMEQQWANDLLDANRLYRETATSAGETGLSTVLDELDRALVEIRNSPPQLSAAEMEQFRRRLDGILFKVRVLGSQVREREQETFAQPLGKS